MNFSRLKLVTEMLAAGAGTALTSNANNKASQAAQASKQVSSTTNNVGAQSTQMAAKPTKSNIASPVQQRTQQAASPTATKAGPQTVVSSVDYFDMLRTKKEYVKQLAEKQSDWRSELTEAVGAKDEVFHPYVDIMPHGDAKLKDAQKKAVVAAKKEKDQGTLMGEETIEERVYMQPQGTERKKREKEEKERNAKAAKDAVRHARMTKGIPFSDAQGKGHIKDGKKIYEQVDPKNRGRGKDKEGRNLRSITGPGTPDAPSFMDRLNQSRVDGGTTTPNKGAHLRTTPAPKNRNWSTPVVPPAMAADKAPPTKTPVTGTMRSGKIPMT